MNEADAVALGIWFGCLFPACYLAANYALDRAAAFDRQHQRLQNTVAAWIGVPISLCVLAWVQLN